MVTHTGRAKVNVSARCLVLVKMYENNSTKLFVKIIRNSEVRISYCAGGKNEKNERGGACGAYGSGERGIQGSGGET